MVRLQAHSESFFPQEFSYNMLFSKDLLEVRTKLIFCGAIKTSFTYSRFHSKIV
jgi:hypothetical protein